MDKDEVLKKLKEKLEKLEGCDTKIAIQKDIKEKESNTTTK